MSRESSVVWSEGMFLSPQHFQQWDRSQQGRQEFLREALVPYSWGARRLGIDDDALSNGQFTLTALDAILPDGTLVRVPDVDALPSARPFAEHFTPELEKMDVYLALPDVRTNVPVCLTAEMHTAAECRLLGEIARIADDQRSGQEVDVVVCRHNLKLLFGTDNRDGYTTLKIAEIERSPSRTFVLSPQYFPPSVSMAAAGAGTATLRSLVEALGAKSSELAYQTRASSAALDVTYGEARHFLALLTINQMLPVLMHFQHVAESHPLAVYLAEAQLAGALCAFAADVHPRTIPAYDHQRLGPTFVALNGLIRELMDKISPPPFDVVSLVKGRDDLMIAEIDNATWIDAAAQWYLQVGGGPSDLQIGRELPRQIIIGSPHNISYLKNSAQPGIAVTHVAVPPRELPLRAHHTYFRLERQGEVWESVKESKRLAIHLAGVTLKNLEYELLIVR